MAANIWPYNSSLVSFTPRQRFIGEPAKTAETSNFKNTIGSLKRLIGRSINDPEVEEFEKKFINAQLVDVNGEIGVKVSSGHLVVFLSSLVLTMRLPRSTTLASPPTSLSLSSLPPILASSGTLLPLSSSSPFPTLLLRFPDGSPMSSDVLC